MPDLDRTKLAQAMGWVIPPDSSPGAGSPACVAHLIRLVETLPREVQAQYAARLPDLKQDDLSDPGSPFARLFVEHVLDVYYGYPDTGAWGDIGFKVNDP